MSTKTLYVAPRMREWKDLKMNLWGIEGTSDLTKIRAPDGVPGVLLVFDSKEALRETYPDMADANILTLQVSQ